MRWSSPRLDAICLLAVVAWAPAARADDAEPPAVAVAEAAPADPESTRAALAAAYAARPSWRGARDLADAELALGMAPEAATHLAEALSLMPKPRDAEEEAALRRRLDVAKKGAATIVVRARARGVTIDLDGESLGTVGDGPEPFMKLVYAPPGEHALVARFDGEVVFTAVRAVEAGGRTMFDVVGDAPARGDKELWPAFALGGIGAVAIGTGIALVVASVGKESDADDLAAEIGACNLDAPSGPCTKLASIVSSRNDLRDGSSIAFVVGGIAAASTIAYLLVPTGEEPERGTARLWLAPAVGPRGAALSVGGAF
jgi:hypothetical protein